MVISFFMPVTHSEKIRPFIDYLRFEKRYSEHTVISYEKDLISFFNFLQENYKTTNVADIMSSWVKTWLASFKAKNYNSRTVNHKISTLKSFFKYQLKKGNIVASPMATITSLKISKRLPQYVEEQNIDTLLRHVDFPDTWDGQTEHLLITILYNTGMRKAELINLKAEDVNFHLQTIKVLGKGNKERIIPVSKELLASINDYMVAKPVLQTPTDEQKYLLVSEKGKRLDPKWMYNAVKKYLSQVTTIEKRSPHILRHSFATHLMNNGADLNAVKELLGHSSLAATQVYTHNSIEKLKEIFQQAHPKAE